MAPISRPSLVAYARRVAQQNGLDPNIFVAQIQAESGFNPDAHNDSGADGIAQLMKQYYPNVDTRDPYASLDAAAQTMGANLKKYDGDYAKALAAYNAGGGAVDKYGGVPPYAETQSYVTKILGSRAKTMGTMQDAGGTTRGGGFMPDQYNPQDDPEIAAIIAAAANGTDVGAQPTSQGSQGAPVDPNAPTPAQQSGIDGNAILRLIEAKKGGGEGMAEISPPTISTTDPTTFMKTETPNPNITRRYTWPDGTYVDIVAPRTGPSPAFVKGGTALNVLSQAGQGTPDTKTFPDGSLRQYDADSKQWTVIGTPPADKADPAPKTVTTKTGTYQWNAGSGWAVIPGTEPAGSKDTFHTMPDGSFQKFDPETGQWTLIQNRYVDPTEDAYKQALTANTRANTAKTIQGLRPTAQAAIEDAYQTIDAIHKSIMSGQTTPKDADALVAQVHAGLSATLAGTTLFEQKKQAEDTQTRRAQTATDLLNQRVQSASSLGASLMQSATGHVLMPKGQTSLGIDPLGIANQQVNAMGGGQQTGDAAAAFLRGALGGGGGGGAPGGEQFPTTREGVLAQYPHLGGAPAGPPPPTMGPQQPAPAPAAPFVPPNPSANAGGGAPGPATPNGNIYTLLASIGQGGPAMQNLLSRLGSPTSTQ